MFHKNVLSFVFAIFCSRFFMAFADNEHTSSGRNMKTLLKETRSLLPTVEVFPTLLKLKFGQVGLIECIVKNAVGDYLVTWETEVQGEKNKTHYQFIANKSHHDKAIKCVVKHGESVIYGSSKIVVESAPRFLKGLSTGGVVTRRILHGTSFTLKCESDEYPEASVKWSFYPRSNWKEKKAVANNVKTLTVDMMNSSTNGIYTCLVENSVGMAKRQFNVFQVPQSPPVIENAFRLTALEHEDVELECECKGCLPIKQSSWTTKKPLRYRSVSEIINEDENTFKTRLRISKAELIDSDIYECLVSNDLGSKKHKMELVVEAAPKNISIFVEGKTSKRISFEMIVKDHEDMTLNCIARAYPVPRTKWYKNGSLVATGKTLSLLPNSLNKLEGKYRCEVSNKLGILSKDFDLKVQIAPHFLELPNNIVKKELNQIVNLNCYIIGVPAPLITWNFGAKPLQASDRNYQLNKFGTVLEFKSSSKTSGVYSCKGVNDYGVSLFIFKVNFNETESHVDDYDYMNFDK